MNLEVISERPRGTGKATPLLFVHGACAGAWVWRPHFLKYFADRGYAAHAVSLRGHGGSDGGELLPLARLSDFAADVEQVAAGLAAPPVLIGHSLGGMVVQKVLHNRRVRAPGAVLMASAPPHGIAGCFVHMLTQNPGLLFDMTMVLTSGPNRLNASSFRRIKQALFSGDTADDVFYRSMPQFGGELMMAVVDLWGFGTVPSSRTLDAPVLVLGAEDDAFISPGALRETAWTYRTEAEIIPDVAHAMMLDHNWERVAERILTWLGDALPERPEVDRRRLAA